MTRMAALVGAAVIALAMAAAVWVVTIAASQAAEPHHTGCTNPALRLATEGMACGRYLRPSGRAAAESEQQGRRRGRKDVESASTRFRGPREGSPAVGFNLAASGSASS